MSRSATLSGGTTLVYDPLGRLWQTSSVVHGTTRFLYDGDRLAAEYDTAGTLRRHYGWGPGVDEPVVQDEGGAMNCSGTRFLHSDHQGSVIAAANCSGTRLSVNSYDEYGVPGAGNWGRFQYTGQAWLPELGMYYYKARIYAPQLGRFMATDPIGYADQINLYAYVANDPVNAADPSGTSSRCQISGACDESGLEGLEGERASGSLIGTGGTTRAMMARQGKTPDSTGMFQPANNSGNGEPGIGHNSRPSLEGGVRRVRAIVGGIAGFIINEVFFPDPAGIKNETANLRAKVLQSGGNTINARTAKALGFPNTRSAGHTLEALKKSESVPNKFHGTIFDNGNYVNSQTGEIIGNILEYRP